MSWKHLCSEFILSLRAIEWWWKGDLLMEAKPCIYTQYCRIMGNTRDSLKSLARPSGNLWNFLSIPKSLCGFQWVILIGSYFWPPEGLGLGLQVGWPQELSFEQSTSRFGRWVETQQNCSQCVPFWIRKVSWDSARLQFWWPCSGVN